MSYDYLKSNVPILVSKALGELRKHAAHCGTSEYAICTRMLERDLPQSLLKIAQGVSAYYEREKLSPRFVPDAYEVNRTWTNVSGECALFRRFNRISEKFSGLEEALKACAKEDLLLYDPRMRSNCILHQSIEIQVLPKRLKGFLCSVANTRHVLEDMLARGI